MALKTYIYCPRPPYANSNLTPGTSYQGGPDKGEVVLTVPGSQKERVSLKHVALDRTIPPHKLEAAATHAAYEARMIGAAYARRDNSFAYTAWFTHCRNLMVFYAGQSFPDDDDVYAQDYFDPADRVLWLLARAALQEPPEYDKYWNAVCKLAAHLTYSRATDVTLAAVKPSRALTEYFGGLTLVFLRRLSEPRLAWFGGLAPQ